MHEEKIPDIECAQCGVCCKIFGDSISPTVENVYFWIENGRLDILRYFSAFMTDGSRVSCADLAFSELSDIVTIELRDPDTGDFVSVCPFLRRVARKKYICSIHMQKPSMCDNYKPWIWGETYFRRCRAIMDKENPSFLDY
jgi:Fe-S-cluster containining protein